LLLALAVPGAWFGAALWALHPVQAESVAWISELKNTQSAVFFLLSIGAYVRWLSAGRGASRHYWFALLAALLALLSKPSTVMLPVVLWLIQGWTRRSWRWRDGWPLLPFFGLSAIAAGWTIWEQRSHSGATGLEWHLGLIDRTMLAARSLGFYLGQLAWPQPLLFIYPRWASDHLLIPALGTLGVLSLLLIAGWRIARGWCRWWLAPACFAALLFPVLGFFNVYFFRYSYVSDHFQYLASIGPLALTGALLAQIPRGRMAVAAVLLAVCGALTWKHSLTFANNETLWRTTLAHNPTAPMAWLNLGAELARQQRHEEAKAAFAQLAALRPDDPENQNDVGWALNQAGYAAEAIPFLQRAVQLAPNLGAARNNLGNALRRLGRLDEALGHYARSVDLQPKSADALNNLGSALAEAGRVSEAIPVLQRAVQLSPDFAPAHANLGTALGLAGRWPEACVRLREAVRLDPNQADAQAKLAVALAQSGRLEESLAYFRGALRLAPDSVEVRRNFTAVLRALGRESETEPLLRSGASRGLQDALK
jgi:tetratricopeptide (TPR) repeat protein